MEIFGFHPWKEIIFLSESITRGLAYHLSSSKVEVLGNIYPAGYENELINEQRLNSSFSVHSLLAYTNRRREELKS